MQQSNVDINVLVAWEWIKSNIHDIGLVEMELDENEARGYDVTRDLLFFVLPGIRGENSFRRISTMETAYAPVCPPAAPVPLPIATYCRMEQWFRLNGEDFSASIYWREDLVDFIKLIAPENRS
jgi:hypothetical protein